MEGFDIKLLSQETGVSEGKIWMILKRNPEMKERPYSFKAGKGRVFLPSFVEWLASYEGIPNDPNGPVRDVRDATLGTSDMIQSVAKLIQQLRLAKKTKEIDIVLDRYLGIPHLPQATVVPQVLMIPEIVSKEEAAAREIGRNIVLKRARALESDKKQGCLDGFETVGMS